VDLADTPRTWVDPEAMSSLHALLFFAGIPLLIIAVLTLLVIAPSLARGPRYRPGQEWDAEPAWFGGPEVGGSDSTPGQITSGPSTPAADTGGASARW